MERVKKVQFNKNGIQVIIRVNSKKIIIEKEDGADNELSPALYRQLINFSINNKENMLHLACLNQNFTSNT